jgi:Flp pilus assembly pilin Flp
VTWIPAGVRGAPRAPGEPCARATNEWSLRGLARRVFRDGGGQDLVEYALLAAFVALAGVATLNLIETAMGVAYTSWEAKTELLSCMPDPGGGGCP